MNDLETAPLPADLWHLVSPLESESQTYTPPKVERCEDRYLLNGSRAYWERDGIFYRIPTFAYNSPDVLTQLTVGGSTRHSITLQLSFTEGSRRDKALVAQKLPLEVLKSDVETFEKEFASGSESDQTIPSLPEELGSARAHLLRAHLYYRRSLFRKAQRDYYRAGKLGLESAHRMEWAAQSKSTKKIREQYPEAFSAMERGEPLRALMHLRASVDENLEVLGPALAYALRSSGENKEGIELCGRLLELNPYQSDLYSHLFVFLLNEKREEDAYRCALHHQKYYPFIPAVYIDLFHSSLLLGEMFQAKQHLFSFLALNSNLNRAVKQLFYFYEYAQDLGFTQLMLDEIVSQLKRPTPETLVMIGEVECDLGNFAKAKAVVERAVEADPSLLNSHLSLARIQARSGDLQAAKRYLQTVLTDRHHERTTPAGYLLVSLLSEIYREEDDLRSASELWEGIVVDQYFLSLVGPQVCREYGIVQTQLGNQPEGLRVLDLLESACPLEQSTAVLRYTLQQYAKR